MLSSKNTPTLSNTKSILKRTLANNTLPISSSQTPKQSVARPLFAVFAANPVQKYLDTSLNETKQQVVPLNLPELSKNLSSPSIRQSDRGHVQQTPVNKIKSPTNSEQKKYINDSKMKTAESVVSFQNCQLPEQQQQQQYDIRITQPSPPPTSRADHIDHAPHLHHQISLPSIEERSRVHSTHVLMQPSRMQEGHKLSIKVKPSKAINETRIKLRDYLFMANTSTSLAASKKRGTFQKSEVVAVKPQTKRMEVQAMKQSSQSQNVKYNYQSEKYRISNRQMSNILKKQITCDFGKLKAKSEQIEQYLKNTDFVQNQDMIKLYALRREVQTLSSKLTQTFSQIVQDSMSVQSIISDAIDAEELNYQEI